MELLCCKWEEMKSIVKVVNTILLYVVNITILILYANRTKIMCFEQVRSIWTQRSRNIL